MLRFALATPWFKFNPATLANDNKGVMGVNLGRRWGEMDMVRGWADHLLAWYGAGRLAIHVDRIFPLEDAAAAHRYVQERRSVGKVILVIER
jgi:NADPH:quinone reductase-like Zn-dependent oxidoreductase